MNRTFLLGTAWTATAAAAVGLGFLAVALVDASASPDTVPLAATSATTSEAGAPTTSASPVAQAEPIAKTQDTVAGIVTATCDGTRLAGLTRAPAKGWWLDDSSKAAEVEFESDLAKLEVTVTCGADGVPVFKVEGPRGDDNGGDDSPASTAPAPAPASTHAPDDSAGRTGGGHGSDDPAADDSSGRGGGGHGSDDSGSGSDDSGSGHGGGGSGGSGHGGGDDSGGDDSGGSGGHGSDD